jgi:hypothetical protein
MEDQMAEEPLEEILNSLDALLGPADSRRRQGARDSRSIPLGDAHQGGVYFGDERRLQQDAMNDALEIGRRRNIAERRALDSFADAQSAFWEKKLANERAKRHR